jgi:DNA-binding LacI/PurR family transcriptional regulator
VIAVDRPIATSAADAVVVDNRAAAGSAVDLLARAGHTEVALLAGPDRLFTMRERRIGFRAAVAAATGRNPRPELIEPDEASIEGGYRGIRRLGGLAQPPTAVVCANYEFTLGATMALNDLGPDLPRPAIVGFDNLDLARIIRPRPTLVVQPVSEIAARAAELVLGRIEGGLVGEPRTIVLDTELVVGDRSTLAAPGGAS